MGMTEIYLSLGSNLGDRQGNLDKAIEMLSDALGVQPEAVSQVIETEPWGFDSKNKFLNMCVLYSVALPEDIPAEMAARGLLYEAKRIERWMGREQARNASVAVFKRMDPDIAVVEECRQLNRAVLP